MALTWPIFRLTSPLPQTPFLNPNALADVFSTVSLAAHSLSGSHPLPASLPSLRERLIYHERHSHATTAPATYSSSSHSSSAPEEEDNNQPLDPSPEKFDGVSLGLKNLTFSTLSSEQLPVYATAGIALAAVYVCFEEIIRETRCVHVASIVPVGMQASDTAWTSQVPRWKLLQVARFLRVGRPASPSGGGGLPIPCQSSEGTAFCQRGSTPEGGLRGGETGREERGRGERGGGEEGGEGESASLYL
jgi:hypothetical protein